MIILCIDPAKKTGYAKFDTKKPEKPILAKGVWTIHKNKFTPSEVIERIADINDGLLFKDVDAVLIEAQGGNLNAHNNGLIKGALLQEIGCTDIETVHPRKWQSFIKRELIYLYSIGAELPIFNGDDNDTKLISKIFASWYVKEEITDDNIADAICMYYWWLMDGS